MSAPNVIEIHPKVSQCRLVDPSVSLVTPLGWPDLQVGKHWCEFNESQVMSTLYV